MADFYVIFQIFQKESNFGGSLLYFHMDRRSIFRSSYGQVSVLPNLQI